MMNLKSSSNAFFFAMLLAFIGVFILILPLNAFMPYPTMLPMDDDPFRILEQTPLTIPKGLPTVALARADWKETKQEHVITLDVPGMKKQDIKIEVEENRVLRISGERKGDDEVEEELKWHRAERTNGKFWRQFRLPMNADLDSVKASLENGVLKVRVRKIVGDDRRKAKVVDIVGEDVKGEDVKTTKAAADM